MIYLGACWNEYGNSFSLSIYLQPNMQPAVITHSKPSNSSLHYLMQQQQQPFHQAMGMQGVFPIILQVLQASYHLVSNIHQLQLYSLLYHR